MIKNYRSWLFALLIIGMVLFLYNSCKKDKEKTVPVLTTLSISNITSTTATCGGNITGGCPLVSERGVCWSKGSNPTTADSKTTDGTGQGNYASTISNLDTSSTYYARAYAINCVGTGYGNIVSFTTQP